MDDQTAVPENHGGDVESAAAKLRALRQRADLALEEQRQRLGSIESELASRVRQLAQEFDQTVAGRQAEGRMRGTSEQMQLQAARSSLDEVRKRCEILEKERAEIEEQRRRDEAERERLLDLLRKAQEQLREQRDAAEIEGQFEQLQQQRDQAQQEVEQLSQETTKLREQAEASAAVQQDLEELRAVSENERTKAAEEIQSLQAKVTQLEEQLGGTSDLQQQLDDATSQLHESQSRVSHLEQEAESTAEQLERVTELESELSDATSRLENVNSQLEQERQRVAELESQAAEANDLSELAAELESEVARVTEQFEGARTQLGEVQSQLEQEQASVEQLQTENGELKQRVEASEAVCQELHAAKEKLDQCVAELDEAKATVLRLERELSASEDEQDARIAKLEQQLNVVVEQRDEAQAEVERLQQETAASGDEQGARVAELEQQLAAVQSESETLRNETADLESQLQAKELQREELAAMLDGAGGDEAKFGELLEELEQTRQKFDLTLGDVQRLKLENEELREELSRRPESSEDPSELVAVRAERDALAERVNELESNVEPVVDVDAEERYSDLQRRFDMAVDDIRQLKQENAELREAVDNNGGVAPSDSGSLDWQAQKARLLAMLDGEEDADEISPERQAERATVEGTVSITDRVVAEKDQEIAELRAALEEANTAEPDDMHSKEEAAQAAQLEAIDSDEAIQQHRTELEQLKSEWAEKLRAAELEISMERAKLAREQAELHSKLADLGKAAEAQGDGADGKPRRRWLSALGLGDESKGDE